MSDVRNERPEPVICTGWAPSIQSDEARDQTEKWLRSILDEPSAEYHDGAFEKPGSGGPMERLIWEINNLGGTVICVSDHWVRVDTVGVVKGTKLRHTSRTTHSCSHSQRRSVGGGSSSPRPEAARLSAGPELRNAP
jgi:hypothetical protein